MGTIASVHVQASIVHVPGVGHAREQRTLYSVAAIIPITCILFVILWTLRRGDLVLAR